MTVDAEPSFGGGDQAVHDHGDVVNVQPRAVKGAVIRLAAEQFDDAAHPALANGVLALDDQGAGTHAHDGAVASPVERQCGLGHLVSGGRRANGQEARADPLHQVFAGHVVGADDDHATATAAADPVFGDGNALGRAGAGGVDLGVGATSADVLGELAMTHGQNTKEEAPVEEIRLMFQFLAQGGDAAVDLALCG